MHGFPRSSRARIQFATVALVVAVVGSLSVGMSANVAAAPARSNAAGMQAPAGFRVSTVLANLGQGHGGNPTGFAYAPDGRIFVARKVGVVDVWDHGVQHVYVDIRNEVNSYQARGLTSIALDPKFATNHRVA